MCIFLKAAGFNHPLLFFRSQRESKSTSASAAECGGPRSSVPPHFYFLYELLSSLPSPEVEMIGEEVRSAPKEATRTTWRCPWATTSPRSPAKEGMKVWSFRASKIICCIIAVSRFCVWTNVIWLLYQHTHNSR